jgi:hypothetical protein
MDIVVFQDDDFWIAHGLQYDIVAQGKSELLARQSFEKIIQTQIYLDVINNKKPFENFEKAPKEIWDKFYYEKS